MLVENQRRSSDLDSNSWEAAGNSGSHGHMVHYDVRKLMGGASSYMKRKNS